MANSITQPVFSVVIPAYNCVHFIGDALQSVLRQTWRDFEIIVIDDGSNDGTGDVVAAFTDERVFCYRQERSGRPACARNAGIRRARGEYIAFLDADDIWYPQKLERILKIFSADPDIGLVCNDERVTRDGYTVREKRYGPAAKDMVRQLLLQGNALSTSATVVRREWLEQVGGFCERNDYYCVEDYDLWIRLAAAGCRFYFLHEILGEYRLHTANSSGIFGTGSPERFYTNVRAVIRSNYPLIKKRTLRTRLLRQRALADTRWKCSESLMEMHQYGRAVAQLIIALCSYPFGADRYGEALSRACTAISRGNVHGKYAAVVFRILSGAFVRLKKSLLR